MAVRLDTSLEPLPGYRLIERLGRGGFGEVWKVEAPGGLLKAMKFVFGDLDSADEDGRPAEQELKALHRVKTIRHPYILSLERFDIIDGQLIIVMELADRNLWDRLRECRGQGLIGIPRDELLRYMLEAAEALDLMNDEFQIQHLDIKPQNIFLVHNHIKVADFGLAKLFEGERATVTGGVTPVYAAPETFEGWISRFTDQYSLGIVYQELLTGTRPFNGANTKQLLMQHLNGQPDLLPLPVVDREIIGRALAKKPDDRWPNCMSMVVALQQALTKSPVTTPPPRTGGAEPLRGNEYTIREKSDTPLPATVGQPTRQRGSSAIHHAPTRTASPPPSPTGPGSVGSQPLPPLVNPGPTALVPSRAPLNSTGLVTPKLVTQGGTGNPASANMPRNQIFQTGRMSSLGIAPPEKNGDGVIMPALVVAVGRTGYQVAQRLRRMIRDTFGSLQAVPCLRFLYIDTDPDDIANNLQSPNGFPVAETILAKLNRPAHYLSQPATSNVEQWLPPGQLYRLPKHVAAAGGIRSFGRLALCDNYRLIAQRIRQEVESFLTDDLITKAGEQTGLGVRTNRARAYVLTGLAGGTGSGMVVDLGYILKQELRAIGYRKPETVGIFLTPPVNEKLAKTPAMANSYAALAELYYFSSGNRYQVRFDPSESPISDTDGPFIRTSLLELPASAKPKYQEYSYSQAARGLFVELLTSAGRVTDYVRSVAPVTGDANTPVVNSFGVFRWNWPRAELLATSVRRFNNLLLQRWNAREATHLKEPIQSWISDQWTKQKLDKQSILGHLRHVAKEALREEPDAVFEAAIDTLRTRTPGNSRFDASAACVVFDQLLKLVGKPQEDGEGVGTLEVTIKQAHKKIATEAEAGLATIAVSFIEQPQYRLAGAEESLNQLTEKLKEQIEQLESEQQQLTRETKEAYGRLFQIIGALENTGYATMPGRKASLASELLEQFRTYSTKRLKLICVSGANTIYRSLLGTMPDYLRDVGYCRTRLTEISQLLNVEEPTPSDPKAEAMILPTGCKSVSDAADQFLAALPPEEILQFDQNMQKELAKRFRGLVNLCLKPEKTPEFITLINTSTRSYLEKMFEKEDPASIFLRYIGDEARAKELILKGINSAMPSVVPTGSDSPVESLVLAAPATEQGNQILKLAIETCPAREFIPAPLADDMLIYREYPRLPMHRLAQLGTHAREAYTLQLTSDHPPHTRMDVRWPSCSD